MHVRVHFQCVQHQQGAPHHRQPLLLLLVRQLARTRIQQQYQEQRPVRNAPLAPAPPTRPNAIFGTRIRPRMDNVTFVVGRQKYVAQLELDEEFVSVTLSVYKSGEDHELLTISWEPRSKWQRFHAQEEGIAIGVAKRALEIWEVYRKTAASKKLFNRNPKPAPKAVQVLRKRISVAMDKRDQERVDTLIAEFNRTRDMTVRLPLA